MNFENYFRLRLFNLNAINDSTCIRKPASQQFVSDSRLSSLALDLWLILALAPVYYENLLMQFRELFLKQKLKNSL